MGAATSSEREVVSCCGGPVDSQPEWVPTFVATDRQVPTARPGQREPCRDMASKNKSSLRVRLRRASEAHSPTSNSGLDPLQDASGVVESANPSLSAVKSADPSLTERCILCGALLGTELSVRKTGIPSISKPCVMCGTVSDSRFGFETHGDSSNRVTSHISHHTIAQTERSLATPVQVSSPTYCRGHLRLSGMPAGKQTSPNQLVLDIFTHSQSGSRPALTSASSRATPEDPWKVPVTSPP